MMQQPNNGHNLSVWRISDLDKTMPVPTPKVSKNGNNNESLEETFHKVERAKQEWESAVDALPELVCVMDDQGRIVRANQTVEHWKLGSLISIKGQDFHELIHPDCVGEDCQLVTFFRQAQRMDQANQMAHLETYDPLLRRHISVKVHPVMAKNETMRPTVAIVIQDITQRKQMEEALASYTNRLEVMNSIGEAILAASSTEEVARAATSRLRQLVPFQRAMLALCDHMSNELLFMDVYSENGFDKTIEHRWLQGEAFSEGGRNGLEKILVIDDLSEFSSLSKLERWLLDNGIVSYLSIPLIAQKNAIGIFILGTEERDAFHLDQIEIANEVGDLLAIATHQAGLNQRIEEANASLQSALQAKEEMIQNVSHELRTPLSIIAGYANLLNEEAFGKLDPEQVSALDIVIGRVDQLEFLVTRLMTLQSLDKNAVQSIILDPNPFLYSLLGSWRLRAESDGIQLQVDVDPDLPEISADQNLLTLAVGTLLDNAIKFSPGGGKITIRSWAENEELYISVSDQGIGVPADKLEKIFERFVQADGSTTRPFGGMGIGLALCHDIVDSHGGRIWAESKGPDKGSTFTIALPVDNGLD
jgi:PAS domain S-box-containing protein